MDVDVRLAASLRELAQGRAHVSLTLPAASASVAEVLDALDVACPGIGRRLRDERGVLRRHVNVFVGADNVRDLGGLHATVPSRAELSILPAVSGG